MQPLPLRIKLYQTSASARKNTFPLGACIYAIIITFCLIAFSLFLAKAIRAGFLQSRLEMAVREVLAKAKQRCVFCTSDRALHSRVKLLMMPADRKTVSDSARPDSQKCTVQIETGGRNKKPKAATYSQYAMIFAPFLVWQRRRISRALSHIWPLLSQRGSLS